MPNRRLTEPEIAGLNALQERVVADLKGMAGEDEVLLFAMRRRLYTRLMYMERGTPAHRTKLKADKWQQQNGLCKLCHKPVDQKHSELDRADPVKGYTRDNTRLVHHDCHVEDQRRKGFA